MWAPAACRTLYLRPSSTVIAAAGLTCVKSPAPNRNSRRWRSGATRRRSATCWRSCRERSNNSRRCANASAARSPPWAKSPRMACAVKTGAKHAPPLSTDGVDLSDSLDRLLTLPTIADKSFLITIGDRTVSGLISRDQMGGPWQGPVAEGAVSLSSYEEYSGEAMAMGERAPVAVLDAP